MDIVRAATSIPARELTRRALWAASYLVALFATLVKDGAQTASMEADSAAGKMVDNYDARFPQK